MKDFGKMGDLAVFWKIMTRKAQLNFDIQPG